MSIIRAIVAVSLIFLLSACKHDPDMDHDGDHSDSGNDHQETHYVDNNENGVNDYFEEGTHSGDGHIYLDENGDGICDRSLERGPYWHGPE